MLSIGCRSRIFGLLVAALSVSADFVVAGEFSLQQHDRGVTIQLDGKLFTEYLIRSGSKPVLWPLIGPDGVAMTRAYPLGDVEGEKRDHIHQRSCWFTHGDVNGVDFWSEPETYGAGKRPANKRLGFIVHREFVKVAAGGSRAEIVTVNDWVDEAGGKHCEDQRSVVFGASDSARWFDFNVELRALTEPVVFGNTKEGSFGIRVPTAIDVKGGAGQIVTSEGLRDKEAWGKRARWVDYSGPIGPGVAGVAILNHPTSFRHPTYWHVRDYGLFAANVFGVHDFEPERKERGDFTLEPGKSISLRYRVILHRGDHESARLDDEYERYAAMK